MDAGLQSSGWELGWGSLMGSERVDQFRLGMWNHFGACDNCIFGAGVNTPSHQVKPQP